jgi:mono/diheme cytochrome c family protein
VVGCQSGGNGAPAPEISEPAYAAIASVPVPKEAYIQWRAEADGRPTVDIARDDKALASAGNPFRPHDQAATRTGRVIYLAHCGSCHGEVADGRGIAMNDQHLPAMDFHQGGKRHAIFFRGGATPRKWFDRVHDGYTSPTPKPDGTPNRMPPFRDALSNEQIWLSLTYLHGVVDGKGVSD